MIAIGFRMTFIAVALIGCSRKSDGLPPSTEWRADPAGAIAPMTGGATVTMASMSTPMGTGDHPSLPPGHPAMDGARAPHGTIGTDVSKLGLPAPDPARPLDPAHHVRGVIGVAPGLEGRMHEGGAVFLIVKRDDHGKPSGPPLAVQKLSWKAGLSFELTERQAMIAGTQLTGDVIVTARYDQDGDALTKQAGDLTGQARVKVPAEAIALALDSVLP